MYHKYTKPNQIYRGSRPYRGKVILYAMDTQNLTEITIFNMDTQNLTEITIFNMDTQNLTEIIEVS